MIISNNQKKITETHENKIAKNLLTLPHTRQYVCAHAPLISNACAVRHTHTLTYAHIATYGRSLRRIRATMNLCEHFLRQLYLQVQNTRAKCNVCVFYYF